jgi:hypothetical protein
MQLGPINFMPYINEFELRNDDIYGGKQQQIFDSQELVRRKEEK